MADPFADFKSKQREGWKHYAHIQASTVKTAATLVRFAGVQPGQRVLDVACGTGPVAITARRAGAKVHGIDLTPELLARAKENAGVAGTDDITWREGDVEALPYKDGEFDAVLSQFGHLFAPRPEVALAEMLRVLKPGGTIAFSTWPVDTLSGALLGTIGKNMPPPPGVPSPLDWGQAATVRQRFGTRVRDLRFEHGLLEHLSLSPQHVRLELEATIAPLIALVASLKGDPARLAAIRRELDEAIGAYHRDNMARFEFLMTRATKA